MNASDLIKELRSVLFGEPWYGLPVITLIQQVDPAKLHDRSHSPHSIADILLHMIAWTEETTERLKGKFASDPARGDWPDSAGYSCEQLSGMFKSANDRLEATITAMDEEMLSKEVNDDRRSYTAPKESYEDLIKGVIQHHIYHSAQIAILNK